MVGDLGYGSYVMIGGTLAVGSNGFGGIRIGSGETSQGVFTQTGGTVTMARYLSIGQSGGAGVLTVSGGTFSGSTSYPMLVGDSGDGNPILNVGTEAGGNGTVVSQDATGLELDSVSPGSSTVNVDSGTLQVGSSTAKSTITRTSGNGYVNLDGGTILAAANNQNLLASTLSSTGGAVYVYNGGAIFNTQNFTATVAANLVGATGNGIYAGDGTGIIAVPDGSGGSGYIGAPLVTVSGGSGSGASAVAVVSGGTITQVILTNPGQNFQVGDEVTFTFSGGGATTAASPFVYTLTANDVAANNGGLTKVGSGTLILSAANTYTGTTIVSDGTLEVDGSLASGSAVTIQSGGTLDGVGTVNGSVTAQSGGTVSPGDTSGILKTGNLALNSGADFNVQLNGTTVGTRYSQDNVTGTVNLDADSGVGATLNVALGSRRQSATSSSSSIMTAATR